MNFVTFGADTPNVKGTDSYFVRLDTNTPVGPQTRRGSVARETFEPSEGPRKRRRHHRFNGRSFFLIVVLIALGSWFAWALQQPGGVSGTINRWIEDVRGEVAQVSSDPDFHAATEYYSAQYNTTRAYPNLSESALAAEHIGIGVDVKWCGPNAVVIIGASGGGSASRLLAGGKEIGTVQGRHECPADLADPKPWNR